MDFIIIQSSPVSSVQKLLLVLQMDWIGDELNNETWIKSRLVS